MRAKLSASKDIFMLVLISVFCVYTFVSVYLDYVKTVTNNSPEAQIDIRENAQEENTSDLKTILFYTAFFGQKDFYFGEGYEPFER